MLTFALNVQTSTEEDQNKMNQSRCNPFNFYVWNFSWKAVPLTVPTHSCGLMVSSDGQCVLFRHWTLSVVVGSIWGDSIEAVKHRG